MRPAPVLALFVFGCTANGAQGMVILGNTAPTGTTCAFSGDPSQGTLSSGEISAESPLPYILTPIVESRFSAGSGIDRSIFLSNANVQLSANGAGLATFSAPVSGTIPPGGTANVSFPAIPVTVLQMLDSAAAPTEVLASVTIIGTEGGGQVDSEPFSYGITVCPKAAECVVQNLGSCVGLTAQISPGNPCNPFQDGVVECCTNTAGQTVCPAVSE